MLWTLALRAAATPDYVEPDIVVPDPAAGAVPLEPLLVVTQYDAAGAQAVLRDPDGAEVPLNVTSVPAVDPGQRYDLLVPRAPLEPGAGYVLTLSYGDYPLDEVAFVAQDVDVTPLAPPVPVRRTLVTDQAVTWSGESALRDGVLYRLCAVGGPALFLVAEGPSEPAAPTPSAPGAVWAVHRDDFAVQWALGDLAPGDAKTLWFATFDAAGGFSGWTGPDDLVMPDAGCTVREQMPGAEGGAGTTPTSFATCPTYTSWVAEPPECGVDSADTAGAPASAACGCGSAPMGTGAALLALLGAWLTPRRRR